MVDEPLNNGEIDTALQVNDSSYYNASGDVSEAVLVVNDEKKNETQRLMEDHAKAAREIEQQFYDERERLRGGLNLFFFLKCCSQ